MPANQLWKVTIDMVETEGQNTSSPWYSRDDIVALLRTALVHGRADSMRDLKISGIKAEPVDGIFYS